jgi:alpha-L-rhamnosidase
MSAPLDITPLRPERVVRTLHVQSPAELVAGDGAATMRCDLGDAEVVLDFGRERVGYFSLTAETAGNTVVQVRCGETEEELTADFARELPWYRFPRDEFPVSHGRAHLRSRGRRAFRFVLLRAPRGVTVELSAVTVHHQHAPVRQRGHFSCSDPLLKRIWDISAYTTELCMQGYYEDGIKRDGLLWIGDARVQFLCAYYAFGDTALAERSLRMIAASQREDGALPSCAALGGGHQHPAVIEYMPDVAEGVGRWIIDNYITDFLSALREYYDHSGDMRTLRELWPCAIRAAGYLSRVPLDPPVERNIITDEDVRVKDSWWPSAGTFLMQLRAGSRDMAACAQVLGDAEQRDRCRAKMAEVDGIIHRSYRHGGVYTDRAAAAGHGPAAPGAPTVSWHVNAFAVLAGVVGPDDRGVGVTGPDVAGADGELLARVAAMPDVAYPIAGFMKFWTLKAMMDAGLTRQAVHDAREYWGFMLEHGATTCWEKLDLRRPQNVLGNHVVSRCHGWSAGPCFLFPRYLLGVAPGGPGYSRVSLRPSMPDGVSWMEGTIPTPRGEIFVRWEALPGGIEGCVVLPPGVEGEAFLPGSTAADTRAAILHPGTNLLKASGSGS